MLSGTFIWFLHLVLLTIPDQAAHQTLSEVTKTKTATSIHTEDPKASRQNISR